MFFSVVFSHHILTELLHQTGNKRKWTKQFTFISSGGDIMELLCQNDEYKSINLSDLLTRGQSTLQKKDVKEQQGKCASDLASSHTAFIDWNMQ